MLSRMCGTRFALQSALHPVSHAPDKGLTVLVTLQNNRPAPPRSRSILGATAHALRCLCLAFVCVPPRKLAYWRITAFAAARHISAVPVSVAVELLHVSQQHMSL
eukprot:356865-Chlamydomonas_euryale.AAC.8